MFRAIKGNPDSGIQKIFVLVESGILGIGIQNPAKEWIQNLFAENPYQIT